MQTVSAEFELELSRDQAWQRMQDLSCPHMYVQGLTAVEFTTDQRQGVGASRRVTQGKSFKLDETVTEWNAGSGFTLRLHRGEKGPIPPLTQHFFDYGIRESSGKVYLHNQMRYSVGLGVFGSLLDKLLLKRVMRSQLRDVTLAQKMFYESGQAIDAAALKSAKAALGH
jgi:hypothetical protein